MSQNIDPQAMQAPPATDAPMKCGESTLDQLKKMSVVVADTGDFKQLKAYKPQDATTNPTLLLQAVQLDEYKHLLDDAIMYGKNLKVSEEETVNAICDKLIVNFGAEILKLVPGVVSSEVDATLSYNTKAMVDKAKKLLTMYNDMGYEKERVLIKLATTWEGCEAAKQLESEGIHCNMTLLFCQAQAVAAAEAKATLISPFVGRILDWHKKHNPNLKIEKDSDDPGVQSVQSIYKHYKQCGYKTIVMGASFRNVGEITELAGCDKLTISPALLNQLSTMNSKVERKLDPNEPQDMSKRKPVTQDIFRSEMEKDPMASEKLDEGIKNFSADLEKLKAVVKEKMK